jgi:hypothetical protein
MLCTVKFLFACFSLGGIKITKKELKSMRLNSSFRFTVSCQNRNSLIMLCFKMDIVGYC